MGHNARAARGAAAEVGCKQYTKHTAPTMREQATFAEPYVGVLVTLANTGLTSHHWRYTVHVHVCKLTSHLQQTK